MSKKACKECLNRGQGDDGFNYYDYCDALKKSLKDKYPEECEFQFLYDITDKSREAIFYKLTYHHERRKKYFWKLDNAHKFVRAKGIDHYALEKLTFRFEDGDC